MSSPSAPVVMVAAATGRTASAKPPPSAVTITWRREGSSGSMVGHGTTPGGLEQAAHRREVGDDRIACELQALEGPLAGVLVAAAAGVGDHDRNDAEVGG